MWYVVRTTSSVLTFLVFLMLVVSFTMAKPRSGKRSPSFSSKEKNPFHCDPDKLMVYKVTLATHWSRTLFPKQYPEWRPPAQWSKVIGKFVLQIEFSNLFLFSIISSPGVLRVTSSAISAFSTIDSDALRSETDEGFFSTERGQLVSFFSSLFKK